MYAPLLHPHTSHTLHSHLNVTLPYTQFQQAKMQQFCRKQDDLNDLFQHLLYDDEKRLVYCYVPKAGSGNMKRMMIILNGIVRPKERYPKEQLKQVCTSMAMHLLNANPLLSFSDLLRDTTCSLLLAKVLKRLSTVIFPTLMGNLGHWYFNGKFRPLVWIMNAHIYIRTCFLYYNNDT